MLLTRRSLLGVLAAPAIIRVADLMPIKSLVVPPAKIYLVKDIVPRHNGKTTVIVDGDFELEMKWPHFTTSYIEIGDMISFTFTA